MNQQEQQTQPTLLFVDDEPSILSSLRRLFRPHDYRILTAESGAQALEIIEQELVDLVISDMRMPIMDGAQFLEQVRHRQPDTIRILLTGYADITSTINAINKGEIYRYVAKPWDDNDIVLIVAKALEHARLLHENARLTAITRQQNEELRQLNSSLEAKVRERTAELEQANTFLNLANDKLKQNFLVSIKMFSGLMELRGRAVAGHSRRVADQARKLAARLDITGKPQQDIFLAALLHDIGKIGLPDALLAKPVSKMSSDELAQYRKHALSGESSLMPLDELKEAAKIIRAHHERVDGLGFPDGLQGEGIAIGARILAVVNDFDALQIGTLTEKKMSADEAKATLQQGRHKRYDAQIVDAFIDMLGGPVPESTRELMVAAADLQPGMVLSRDLISREGVLLLAADYVLDALLVRQIQDFARREGISLTLHIRTDKKL